MVRLGALVPTAKEPQHLLGGERREGTDSGGESGEYVSALR
jgi:hypothetical protein